MKIQRENRRLLIITAIVIVSMAFVFVIVYYFLSKYQKQLIEEKKEICLNYANQFSAEIEKNVSNKLFIRLFNDAPLSVDSAQIIDRYFTGLLNDYLIQQNGLEGGVYILKLDDFKGYAFPTSPPPVPAYGPPPRSHQIIKNQALASLDSIQAIVNVHSFDPAVFPLATVPFMYNKKAVGAVWIRIHIERELPLARFLKVANFLTIISVVGFLVMAMFSLFLSTGIKQIKRELDNTKLNQSYRLKIRGGWFGFIPARINEMLDILEKENQDRKNLQKQLQQEEKLASLGKMVAGVAHEVKTPLAVIKMRVQMWEKEILKEEDIQKKIPPEGITLVLDEINRLSSLVKRLVVFSRPICKNLRPISLEQTTDEVLSMINPGSLKMNVSITKNYCDNCPQIFADGNTVKQVLINILNNSFESVAKDGAVHISTSYLRDEKMVALEIEDNGPGIPLDIIDKVFDPFFTSKEKGTGLGLAISHEIMLAHNGSITFLNGESRGLKCSIKFPVKKHEIINGN